MSTSPVVSSTPDSHRPADRKAAFSRFLASVRADHEMLVRSDAKYDTRGRQTASIAHDLVERIGFQMMTAYRLMQLLKESGSPLGAKITGRMIRLLYGADIHYDCRIEDGVAIAHGMGIAIAHSSQIGKGVILSHNVTIGDGIDPRTRAVGQPTLEEDVHVGPGAILLGPIIIGARSKIMPGAVVQSSVPPDSVVETPAPVVRPRKKRPEGTNGAAAP
jgi:serine O-acetyltransferase